MFRAHHEKGEWKDKPKGGGQKESPKSLVEGKVSEILDLNKNNVEFFIKTAYKCAEKFKDEKVTTKNQIMNFYEYVKNIEKGSGKNIDTIKFKLHLLKPKIAYAVGRKKVSETFQKTFEDLINGVKTEEEFDNFVKFFEAIVAYYTYHKKSENESER